MWDGSILSPLYCVIIAFFGPTRRGADLSAKWIIGEKARELRGHDVQVREQIGVTSVLGNPRRSYADKSWHVPQSHSDSGAVCQPLPIP